MRTLPLRLAPVDGESLPGYIARYAHRFQIAPGDVADALGLRLRGRYGVWLAPGELQHVAHAAGLDTETVAAMLLARYVGGAFERPPANAPVTLEREIAAGEVSVWTTRLCPRCLHQDGAWRLGWQLGWSVACTRHQLLLVRRCSRCQTVPRVGARQTWPRDRGGQPLALTRCARRRRGELCGAPLTAATIAAGAALVATQQRIDALLDGHQTPRLAGEPLPVPVYLRDLRTLALLLRGHTPPPPGDARAERACGGSRRPLDDPLSRAAVLVEAIRLADLPDRATLADALRELADRRYRERRQTLQPAIHSHTSPILSDALQLADGQATYARPSTRIGVDPRAYRRPPELDERLQPRHVPQLFWTADYQQQLAELFDFDDFSLWLGRRFCSILLARMLAPLDWRAAVAYLDLPDRFENHGYNTTFVKLRSADRFDELAARIKQIANQHATDGLIDYKQRRQLLADWAGIDRRTWQLLAPRSRPRTPRADAPDRRAHASVWVWCLLTSGHEHAAPVALPGRGTLNQHTLFTRRHIPALRGPLTLLGELLLNTPADARSTLPDRLAAALHEHGYLAQRCRQTTIDALIADHVLAHTSAHTGIDITSLTTAQPGSGAPAAVTHARLLAGALLHRTAHASWAAVAATIGGSPQRLAINDRAYRAAITDDTTLAAELEQLTHAVDDWHTAAPAAAPRPHNQRMPEIATAIRAQAADLFPPDLAARASMLACRTHTDLTWPQIAALHDLPAAHPTLTHATIAHHCSDPDVADRFQELLDHAQHVRAAAGYSNAQLTRGLTAPRRREDPIVAQQETSCQNRNFD